MYVVTHRALFFWITGLILAASVVSIAIFGLPLSIDFTGGSLVEVQYANTRPSIDTLTNNVKQLALGEISLRESGDNGVILRTRTLTPAEHEAVLGALGTEIGSVSDSSATTTPVATTTAVAKPISTATSTAPAAFTELRFNSIGPSYGTELAQKSLWAIVAVCFAIVLYIAWAFRRVSRPVPNWGYGLIVVAMLAIDIIVPTGFYAALCHFTGAQVDPLFVVALLALLGYCVNDVIVIFDRVREHLHDNEEHKLVEPFETTIGSAIDQTITRSINIGLTVALALLSLIFVGAPATRDFALVMLVGVLAGTFSSIARSAPLLIPIANRFAVKEKNQPKKGKKR